MFITAPYIILISLLLFLGDLGLMIYAFGFRKKAIVQMGGFNLVLTLMIGAVFVFSCIKLIILSNDRMFLENDAPLDILLWSIFITVMLIWEICLIKGADRTSRQLLEALVGTTEANSPNLNGHAMHVKLLSTMLYRQLPVEQSLFLNPEELSYAAMLIDVGQVGIPRELREKWGKLSPEERDLVRRSSDIASGIIKSAGSFKRISEWIRMSGEHVDGSGRLGLKGDEIPLASKILAVANTYSAITLTRTYKASRSYGEAVEELRMVSGTQLDEQLVELFCQIPIEQIEECREIVEESAGKLRNISSAESGSYESMLRWP